MIVSQYRSRSGFEGIPSHIEIEKQQKKLLEAIQALPSVLLTEIIGLIEGEDGGTGNIARELLQTTIRDLIVEVYLVSRTTDSPLAVQDDTHDYFLGTLFLQEDFEYPSVDPLLSLKLWQLGDES